MEKNEHCHITASVRQQLYAENISPNPANNTTCAHRESNPDRPLSIQALHHRATPAHDFRRPASVTVPLLHPTGERKGGA